VTSNSFLLSAINNLTESTSITLAKQIQVVSLNTPLSVQAHRYADLFEIATTYVQQGEGETPILLLHGFDSSLFEYRRLLPILAQHHETWAVDLLGFGFSERRLDLPITPETIKTHLYFFWKTFIQRPVILVGASMGGATALDFTLTYPEAVEKLVLIDSAGLAKPPVFGKYMFYPLDFFATAFLKNPSVRRSISKAAYYDQTFASLDAQLCAALHLQCENWNKALIAFTKSGGYGSFLTKISAIEQPTLILWGEHDKILGIKDATRFEKQIPNSKLVWIKECGHVPHLEKPQVTAKHILEINLNKPY
jgi:pimeloyl-ACP methyl ester carboxylesterase